MAMMDSGLATMGRRLTVEDFNRQSERNAEMSMHGPFGEYAGADDNPLAVQQQSAAQLDGKPAPAPMPELKDLPNSAFPGVITMALTVVVFAAVTWFLRFDLGLEFNDPFAFAGLVSALLLALAACTTGYFFLPGRVLAVYCFAVLWAMIALEIGLWTLSRKAGFPVTAEILRAVGVLVLISLLITMIKTRLARITDDRKQSEWFRLTGENPRYWT